jgi:hypothetical protein
LVEHEVAELLRQRIGGLVLGYEEATIQLLSATHPEEPARTWSLLRDAVREGWQNVDRRLLEHGPLEPSRFSLQEANERLARLSRGRTWL